MPSAMPRIQCHVISATKARLHQMSVDKGMIYGQIIDEAIAQYNVDRKSWVAHQAGYQTLLGTAVMLAWARKSLTTEEFRDARKTAEQADVLLFGPLGKRPFDIDVNSPIDDRLLASCQQLQRPTMSDENQVRLD